MERRGPADLLLFFITLVLLAIGLIMVLSASSYEAMIDYNDALHYFKRQLIFMALGFVFMFIMMNIKPEFIKGLAVPAMICCVIMLLLLPIIGVEVGGSKRWLGTTTVRFAPAEIAKPVVIVFFAMWLSSIGKKNLQTFKGFFYTLLILAVIPGLVVIEDLGTAIVIAGALVCMMIAAEVPWKYLGGTMGIGLLGVIGMIVVKPYRMKRITAFLDPFADPSNTGYQVVQSLYAIGSGWLFGVGLGASRQKLFYLPERHTDFIFSIIDNAGWNKETNGYATFVMRALREVWIAHPNDRKEIHRYLSKELRQIDPALFSAEAKAKYPKRDHRVSCVLYVEDLVCDGLGIEKKIYVENGKKVKISK